MTVVKRINLAIIAFIVGAAVVGGMAFLGYSTARGDSGSAVVVPAPGSGSMMTPAPAPHDQLKDPTLDPQGAISDLEMAKKKGGWLGLILVGLYALCRLAGKLGKNISWLKVLDEGRMAAIIAGCGTILSGCVDAFLLGGTYVTIGIAALYGIIGLLGTSKPKDA